MLASADAEGSIRVWDPWKGREVRKLGGHPGPVASLSVSPDGKTLASAAEDGSTRLWDLSTGAELRQFATPGRAAHAVAFSPDGRTLAGGLEDGTVLVWSASGEGRAPSAAPARENEVLWRELASDDAAVARRAGAALVAAGAADFLRLKLRPDPAETARVAELVRQLEAEFLEDREQAAKELRELAHHPEVWKSGGKVKDLAVSERSPFIDASGSLRRLRAIRALEALGAAEALEEFAKGAPEARQTRAAGSALRRLRP
jgi:hypothetical protein